MGAEVSQTNEQKCSNFESGKFFYNQKKKTCLNLDFKFSLKNNFKRNVGPIGRRKLEEPRRREAKN